MCKLLSSTSLHIVDKSIGRRDYRSVTIGRRLRERREAAGLTGDDVTERGGPGKSYLSQLETGARGPNSWPLIALLARLYETSTDYLLGLTDDPAQATTSKFPPYGADVLEIMRDLPPSMALQILEHAQVVHTAMQIERDRYPEAYAMIEQFGQPLYDELALYLMVQVPEVGRQSAFDELKARLIALRDANANTAE